MSVKTVENMVEWVEENIENEPTLDRMAVEIGYSKFYCSAKFHEYVGMSYKEYVLKRKLSLAADLLLKTDERLIDIAVKYGFSSHIVAKKVCLTENNSVNNHNFCEMLC